MLPAAYQVPAAAVLLAGGFLACFLGYRMFKVVLAVFGFMVGALAASSVFGGNNTTPMIIAALVGGIAGGALLLAAYFVGVALVGAGIGALLVNVIWTQIEGDPHPAVVIIFSVAGAVVATWLQRYVIILGTAFAGAWTMLVGGLAMMGDSSPLKAAAAGDVWVAYPLNPAPDMRWLPWAWFVLGTLGTLIQMRWTGGDRGRIGKAAKANKKKPPKEE
ncbi:MAG: TMEM198/TM7SF3 family protein [Cyanobacteria bacterium]|nr:TMEM198/TM7SF3 family protein [Cyanobacteriota bacterium]